MLSHRKLKVLQTRVAQTHLKSIMLLHMIVTCFDHEFDMYRKHLDTWPNKYADDYIKFFRSSGVGRGRFIEEAIGDYKV